MTDLQTSPIEILNGPDRIAHARCCKLPAQPFIPFTALCGTRIEHAQRRPTSRCVVCVELDRSDPNCPDGGICPLYASRL